MNVTISYTAFLLTILTGVAVATMVYLIVVLGRLNRAAAKLDGVLGKADDLLVSLQTLAEESTGTVVAARQLIDEGTSVAADIAALSNRVRDLAEVGTGHTASLFDRLKSAIAIVAGVRTAYATLRHFLQSRRQAAADDKQ
jgi:low affinity Fe/Cu permease